MASTISASQGPRNPRLGEVLLGEQCVTARLSPGTTEKSSASKGGRARKRAHLALDAAQAHWHLDLLGLDETCTNIRFIPHKGRRGRAINGNFGRDLERAQDLNAQGYGVYLQPNIANGTKADEVIACTALFCEWDDRSRADQVLLWQELGLPQPTFQLDTGGKSIHTYWVMSVPVEPERWVPLMDRLVAHAGSDRSCKGTNRMMRLAGSHYINCNGESQGQVQIINADGPRYSAEELDAVLPPLPVPSQPKPKRFPPQGRHFPGTHVDLQEIGEALDHIPRRVEGSGTYADYRNILWGLIDACAEAGYGEQVAIDLMEVHSPSRQCGWDIRQIARSGGEQITAGTFWWQCRQHGWEGS